MPAPKGNKNAAVGKRWATAIDNALKKRTRAQGVQALDELAGKLLDKCSAGDLEALKELGNRLDGKPGQQIELGNLGGKPFVLSFLSDDDAL